MSRTWGGMKLCRCGLSPEPKGQITEPGLTETVGTYIGCGVWGWAGLTGKLSKAERGFCLCLGHRGCVLNNISG